MLLRLVNVLVFESLQPILVTKKIGGGGGGGGGEGVTIFIEGVHEKGGSRYGHEGSGVIAVLRCHIIMRMLSANFGRLQGSASSKKNKLPFISSNKKIIIYEII